MELKLPSFVVSPGDVMRLARELNTVEDFFVGAAARKAGTAVQMPKLSQGLEQLATENKLNLLDGPSRAQLAIALSKLVKNAPTLHISFASEPTPKHMEPIVLWLRENIHPLVLIQIGLQPAIAAGCVVRTNSKIFDMGIRKHLQAQSGLLLQILSGALDGR